MFQDKEVIKSVFFHLTGVCVYSSVREKEEIWGLQIDSNTAKDAEKKKLLCSDRLKYT